MGAISTQDNIVAADLRVCPPVAGRSQRGQSLVEFALMLPIFLIVLFILVDFGIGFSRWLVITNAAREGARLGAVNPVTAEITDRAVTTSNGLLTPDGVEVNCSGDCKRGDSVVVKVNYDYQPITPFVKLVLDSLPMSACSDMRLEIGAAGVDPGGGC